MGSEVEAKKPKISVNAGENNPNCAHWVHRKKRYCKMTVKAGQRYCGEHQPSVFSESSQLATEADDNVRIPCPLDAKHTVFKKKLQKHLQICNARDKGDAPAYIEKGINLGMTDVVSTDYSKLRIHDLPDEEFYKIVSTIKALYAKFVENTIESIHQHHKLLETELANSDYGHETRKHLLQASALLGILDSEKQILASTSYVEFGAGKGQLAYYLAHLLVTTASQVVLVDRMSLRHKKDNKIEDRSLVHRIRADIADFRMSGLKKLRSTRRCVAVSKHLCGAATDLTLRCITQPRCIDEDSKSPGTEYVLIALCCHHRCDWQVYVGKSFFQEHGLTSREFAVITKMASWAICGTGMSRERRRALEEQSQKPEEVADANSKQRLSLAERERIGGMCKRILDYGRLQYLRSHGFKATLKYYVDRDVTLENVCLIARKIDSSECPEDEKEPSNY
ncbi:PREDICTED: LOW QUALITY PROTEIN: tRNA:m(4)X modification enzyme TRM13 homolog [Rhagoletis zephyria]|uniref:LOW QUALITY PROTEIN: tRNA:m(4)X modification enzyme TRM13 homolog n=1 Tax=Rhagoletis zephyria TaxID=28612 RepID=UPI0008118ED9|nr:PREDICTED: LOW QUALITY PROTEIN: tRNA:m(4)X modification enzyme TRM13 homolog [Rhagoletis zephyria]